MVSFQELFDRLKAIQEADEGYRSFAGISDNMDGSVKFIVKRTALAKKKRC